MIKCKSQHFVSWRCLAIATPLCAHELSLKNWHLYIQWPILTHTHTPHPTHTHTHTHHTHTHTQTPRVLHSVTLFDSFLTDYDITGACLITPGSNQKLNILAKSDKGVGILLNQKFNPSDKIQLRVRYAVYCNHCLRACRCSTSCILVCFLKPCRVNK